LQGSDHSWTRLRGLLWQALTDGTPVVLTAHERADGDSLGSTLALWHALKGAGVAARAFFQRPLPPALEFLPGLEDCPAEPQDLPATCQLVLLDCGDLRRAGPWAQRLAGMVRTFNIDHHAGNTRFADLNLVDAAASSCGEIVHELIAAAGVPLTRQIAECIFAAIVTDTGRFAFANTTPGCLEVCARCVRAGASPRELGDRLFMSQTKAQFVLRQMTAGTLQLHDEGRIATLVVTRAMFCRTGLGPVHTDRFADMTLSIRGVMAGALLKELPDSEYIKVSMRSRAPVDVRRVAEFFGGGGHARAAGFEIRGGLDNARTAVLERLQMQFDAAHGN